MQSWLEERNWVGKCAQATGMATSLSILSSKADSNTWEIFTRSELKLESVHQESPHYQVLRAIKPLLKQKHRHLGFTLPGLRSKITRLLLSGPKSSFQMKIHFAFHLEIKFPESEWSVERHIIHVAWSPVRSSHSQWWFGMPCHLLVLVHCVFWSPQSTQPSTRKFLSTSCFLLLTSFVEMLILFYSRTLHLPTLPKVPKAGSMTMVLLCLIGHQTRLTWTP